MKRTMILGVVALAALFAVPATASAGDRHPRWSFGFGVGRGGPYFEGGFSSGHRHRRVHRHVHNRLPRYKQVWVPPVYERRLVGYERCGRPIFRHVEVRCGHYDTVVVGYHCECGHAF